MRCPVCRSKFSIDDLMRENINDELISLAAFFGKNWALFNEYCDCFRSGQWQQVSEKKKLRLLTELKMLFERCEFEYDGKRYRTDRGRILASIRVVVDAEKFGFKNHNYLKRVMLGGDLVQSDGKNCVRPQRVSAEGMTAKEEAEKLKGQRSKVKGEEITGAEFMKRNNLENLIDGIGRKME
jgi:hypothetical protein